jgi:DNA-directed RNA polymerase sigma subunit (sigma70/sigma32)
MYAFRHNRLPAGITPERTLREVADIVGLSVSRVKQIESDALRKMRHYLDTEPELCRELEEALS